MKTQPILLYLCYSFLFIFTLFLSSCKDENDTDPKDDQSVTDIDGNIYPTVVIGDQIWTTSNLITTHYKDGSEIDFPGSDTIIWQENTNGAYAWQRNNDAFKEVYGGLYNWYAVNNSNGLCPAGWRVSTAEDWRTLLKYLFEVHGCTNDNSGDKHAGSSLKSCKQNGSPLGGDCVTADHPRWEYHETQYGTDDFGFSALPGGSRGAQGNYSSMGLYGYWWVYDPLNDTDFDAQSRYINFDQNRVYGGAKINKNMGLSVRCVKDN